MTRRAGPRTAAVLGLLAILAAVPAAPAQPPPAPDRSPFLEGTHAFRRILYDVSRQKLAPLRDADATTDPERTLIVVLGNPAPLVNLDERLRGLGFGPAQGYPRALSTFVGRGGALLIATDQKTPGLEVSFGWSVRGEQLKLLPPGRPEAYRGMAECPFIDPLPGQLPALFEPGVPAVRGQVPPKVASNLPSSLQSSRDLKPAQRLPELAWLPQPCRDDRGNPGPWTFAAGGSLGSGRVLLMADHSVFINEMMLQTDNGNIDFAYRCAEWLLTVPGGRRNQILYYEDGSVQKDFAIPLRELPPPPLPPPDTLLGMLDETLHAMEQEGTFARMEQEDFFNGVVDDVMRSAPFWQGIRPEWKLWTLIVIAVSAVLGLYGFVRLGMFRHRPDAATRSLAVLLGQQAPVGAVLAQRHEALLREGNLWEAARALARHLFASAGVTCDAGRPPPVLEVRGPWRRRWQQRRAWRRLWRLSCSLQPVRVAPRAFTRLAQQAEALRAVLADGTARVSPTFPRPSGDRGAHRDDGHP